MLTKSDRTESILRKKKKNFNLYLNDMYVGNIIIYFVSSQTKPLTLLCIVLQNLESMGDRYRFRKHQLNTHFTGCVQIYTFQIGLDKNYFNKRPF